MTAFAAIVLINGYIATARTKIRDRFSDGDPDAGFTTLEAAVMTLGLILIAGVFVAVITAAVNRRLDQIT